MKKILFFLGWLCGYKNGYAQCARNIECMFKDAAKTAWKLNREFKKAGKAWPKPPIQTGKLMSSFKKKKERK